MRESETMVTPEAVLRKGWEPPGYPTAGNERPTGLPHDESSDGQRKPAWNTVPLIEDAGLIYSAGELIVAEPDSAMKAGWQDWGDVLPDVLLAMGQQKNAPKPQTKIRGSQFEKRWQKEQCKPVPPRPNEQRKRP